MAAISDFYYLYVYSNDGSTKLACDEYVDRSSLLVFYAGLQTAYIGYGYDYTGNRVFLGVSMTPNTTVPDYPVGTTISSEHLPEDGGTLTLYIVEGDPARTVDLLTLGLPAGTHSITVVAKATGYSNSDPSKAVKYTSYTLSGTWVFNEKISDHSPPYNKISFVSNDATFSGTPGNPLYGTIFNDGQDYIRYWSGDGSVDAYDDDAGVWLNEAYRTITFDGEQIVSQEFYEWFTANATFAFTVSCSTSCGDRTYYAEAGMTWGEWLESAYNTDGWEVLSSGKIALTNADDSGDTIYYQSYTDYVTTSDVIEVGYAYIAAHEK